LNEITAITPQLKDKSRCNIYIDGRFYCGMSLETTVKNRLKVGLIISPEQLSLLQLESEKSVALDKALTHISATRKTEKQVREFLKGKGYLEDVIEYVLEKLRGYDFLNDQEYAEAYVDYTACKKGARLIRMELKNKGVSEQEIDSALSLVSEDTQIETAKTILTKYMKNKEITKETLQKAFRYLMGKGFDIDVVKSAIQAFGDCEDE